MSKKRVFDLNKFKPGNVDSVHFDRAAKARATARANQIRKKKKANGKQRYRVSVKKGDPKTSPFGNFYIVEKKLK